MPVGFNLEEARRRAVEGKKTSNYVSREKLLKENADLRAKLAYQEGQIRALCRNTIMKDESAASAEVASASSIAST